MGVSSISSGIVFGKLLGVLRGDNIETSITKEYYSNNLIKLDACILKKIPAL